MQSKIPLAKPSLKTSEFTLKSQTPAIATKSQHNEPTIHHNSFVHPLSVLKMHKDSTEEDTPIEHHTPTDTHFGLSNAIARIYRNMDPDEKQAILHTLKPYNLYLKSELVSLPPIHVKNLLHVSEKYEESYAKIIMPEVWHRNSFKAKASLEDLMNLYNFDYENKGIVKKPSEIKEQLDSYEEQLIHLQKQLEKKQKIIADNEDHGLFCFISISENEKISQEIESLQQKITSLNKSCNAYRKVAKITKHLVHAEIKPEKKQLALEI